MMAGLAAGRADALVVWDVDRLTRTPRELEDVVDLAERRGIALASVGGDIDLATPQGRLTARIKGSVARHESEQLARRVQRKIAERAESGAPHGRTAYGWRREQIVDDQGRRLGSRDVIHPEQARVIRSAAAAILAGDSLRSVVGRLNAEGERINGRPFTHPVLRDLLLRERNAGLRVHRGRVIGKAAWEPVLDEDTYRRLVAALTDPSRRTTPGSQVRWLLSGLARCGKCGGPLRGLLAGRDGRLSNSYVCTAGYHVRINCPELEDLVQGLVVARLGQPDAAAALTRGDPEQAAAAREQHAAIRARLDLAADSFAAGQIDGGQLARITGKLRPELERWEAAVRAASAAPDLTDLAAPDVAERWSSLSLDRRRAVIRLLLAGITVGPAARAGRQPFDPNRVRVQWATS